MSERRPPVPGEVLILAAALVWGVAFYFQKSAMAHVGPVTFVGLRTAIAALVLLPFALIERRASPVSGPALAPVAFGGAVLFFMAATIQQAGLVTATVINTGLLTALYIVIVPFLVWALRRKPPSAAVWLATGLAFAGVWLLGGGGIGALSRGDALVALSALFWAAHLVYTAEVARRGNPIGFVCLQFAFVALMGLCLAGLLETITTAQIVAAAPSLLYVGVLSSAMTFGLMALAMRTVPAVRASILLSTETIFAAIAGIVLLGEGLTSLGWVGAVLMFAALIIVGLGRRDA